MRKILASKSLNFLTSINEILQLVTNSKKFSNIFFLYNSIYKYNLIEIYS